MYVIIGSQVNKIFGPLGNRPKHLNNVQCIGNESNLCDCYHEVFISPVNCTYDVGVSCSFDMLCKCH